jgi:peptide deformylase
LINPQIVQKDGAMVGNEGCLSFPEVFATVRRARHVVVNALDRSGKPFTIEADNNLLSRALQHEIDHLDGKLFIEKFSPTDKFTRRHRLKELEDAYEAHLSES